MKIIKGNTENTLFAIRGSLDGELENEFLEDREQFIGLKIGSEEFYLPIANVIEIIMLQPITYVPQCNKYVEGVINLRGKIIPALNLRKMMGLEMGQATAATRIIITNQSGLQVALIVDAITYVISLSPNEIETQSLPGKNSGSELISRISKSGERILGIIDIAKVINQTMEQKLIPSIEVENEVESA